MSFRKGLLDLRISTKTISSPIRRPILIVYGLVSRYGGVALMVTDLSCQAKIAFSAEFRRMAAFCGKEDLTTIRPILDGRLSGLPSFDSRDGRRSTESRQFESLLEKDWRSHFIDVKRRHRIDFRQSTFCRLSSKAREGKAESRPSISRDKKLFSLEDEQKPRRLPVIFFRWMSCILYADVWQQKWRTIPIW